MYRMCLECNNGQGRRLAQTELVCSEDHDALACLLEPGDILGDFQIEARLPTGDGGQAMVYRARTQSGSYPPVVALKVARLDQRHKLEREAAVLATLGEAGTAHVVRIYPIASAHQAPPITGIPEVTVPYLGRAVLDLEPLYYLVLDLLPGGSLRDRLERRAGRGLDVGDTLRVVQEIGMALSGLHAAGLIHLDVKPANIMFDAAGAATLIDFGIAVHQDGEETTWPGTAPYAPREQINQDYPDLRADVHALGVTAFEMLTGQLPYRGSSATALATSVCNNNPLPLAQAAPRLAYLGPVLDRALDPNPAQRYPTVAQFVTALEAAASAPAVGGSRLLRRGLILAGAGTLSLVFVLLAAARMIPEQVPATAVPSTRVAATLTATPVLTIGVSPTSPIVISFSPVPPTSTSQSDPTQVTTPLPEMVLTQPDNGVTFSDPNIPIALNWTDLSAPLGGNEQYNVQILGPDHQIKNYPSTESVFVLPLDAYETTAGDYFWQIYRIKDKDPNQRVSNIGDPRMFTWKPLAPTATPSPPPAPTSIVAPTPTRPRTTRSPTATPRRTTPRTVLPTQTTFVLPTSPPPPTTAPQQQPTTTQPPPPTDTPPPPPTDTPPPTNPGPTVEEILEILRNHPTRNAEVVPHSRMGTVFTINVSGQAAEEDASAELNGPNGAHIKLSLPSGQDRTSQRGTITGIEVNSGALGLRTGLWSLQIKTSAKISSEAWFYVLP